MSQENELKLLQEIERLKRQVERLKVGEVGGSWVYLTAPLTSTAWDGDARSTTGKTLIDLSAEFGVPAGIKAALFACTLRDSGSASKDCWILLSTNGDDNYSGMGAICPPVNDRYGRYSITVPCNEDGDIYYRCQASGSGTLDVFLNIFGYRL